MLSLNSQTMSTYDIMKRGTKSQNTLNDVTRDVYQLIKEKIDTDPEAAKQMLDELMVSLDDAKPQLERLEREYDL